MNRSKPTGFTIVELIIVIAVIGILASIIAISYTAAIDQSKTKAAYTSANVLAKKLENYYSSAGAYPTIDTTSAYTAALNSYNDSSLIGSSVTIIDSGSIDRTNGQTAVAVSYCTAPAAAAAATAYKIDYWDYTTGALSLKPIIGNAGSTACTDWHQVN